MDIQLLRCKHCGTQYRYQASGYGCFDQECGKEYCADCLRVMNKALEDIPVKFIMVYEPTNEITIEEIKEWEEKERQKAEEVYDSFLSKKGYPPLTKMPAPILVVPGGFRERKYRWKRYYTKFDMFKGDIEIGTVYKRCAKNIETNEIEGEW